MQIITTREIRNKTKEIFELAEQERIVVKRVKKYVNLIVTDNPDAKFVSDELIKEFMYIPAEYRCNPFEISPSGDLFFADKRNIAHIEEAVKQAKEGKTISMQQNETLDDFLNRI